MSQEFWIAARYWQACPVEGNPHAAAWECLGLFDTEAGAVAACNQPLDFVAPLILNERLSDEPEPWPGAYYPRLSLDAPEGAVVMTAEGGAA